MRKNENNLILFDALDVFKTNEKKCILKQWASYAVDWSSISKERK